MIKLIMQTIQNETLQHLVGPICLVDADLLDGGTRFPNLAVMKLSGYFKERGCSVTLAEDFSVINPADFEAVFVSKVFDFTKVDDALLDMPNVYCGGTGFFFDKATPLPYEIEHHMPDYHVYDDFIANDTKHVKQKTFWKDYRDYSIGFATRGCFRQCPFCVNRHYKKVEFNAHISEFHDPATKGIILLDDNILGYAKWKEVFAELTDINKPFVFKQGMDIRLMTTEKARILDGVRYIDDFIFAFDNIEDAPEIEQKLKLWREHCNKPTKLYVLSGFVGTGGGRNRRYISAYRNTSQIQMPPVYNAPQELSGHSIRRHVYPTGQMGESTQHV